MLPCISTTLIFTNLASSSIAQKLYRCNVGYQRRKLFCMIDAVAACASRGHDSFTKTNKKKKAVVSHRKKYSNKS